MSIKLIDAILSIEGELMFRILLFFFLLMYYTERCNNQFNRWREGIVLRHHHSLADYLEELWDKGFKLTDAQVRFIYFAKKYTNSSEWLASVALENTLKLQFSFSGSFYIRILEVLNEHRAKTKKDVELILKEKGIY